MVDLNQNTCLLRCKVHGPEYQMEAAFLFILLLPSSVPLIPSSYSSSGQLFSIGMVKVIWLNELWNVGKVSTPDAAGVCEFVQPF